MKPKSNRKEIQEKLNRLVNDAVKSVITTDSKKIQKTIKKVSKILAKAVSKKMGENKTAPVFKKPTAIQSVTTVNKNLAAPKKPVVNIVKPAVQAQTTKNQAVKNQPVKKVIPPKDVKKPEQIVKPVQEIKNGTEKQSVVK